MDHLVGAGARLLHIDGDAKMPCERGLRRTLFEILKILNAADGKNVRLNGNEVPVAFPQPALGHYGDTRGAIDKHKIELFICVAQESPAALPYLLGLAGSDDVALDKGEVHIACNNGQASGIIDIAGIGGDASAPIDRLLGGQQRAEVAGNGLTLVPELS